MTGLFKRIFIILLTVAVCLSLTACGNYISSYSAIGMVRSNTRDTARVSFMSLDGRLVFKLHAKSDSVISYEVSLDGGTLSASYDSGAGETALFTVTSESGESVGNGGEVAEGESVYIIIYADGASGGEVRLALVEKS